jgi:predicted small secreted protein
MKTLSLLILAIASVALTSCNTISGAGQDIKRGGQAVSDAAKRAAN